LSSTILSLASFTIHGIKSAFRIFAKIFLLVLIFLGYFLKRELETVEANLVSMPEDDARTLLEKDKNE